MSRMSLYGRQDEAIRRLAAEGKSVAAIAAIAEYARCVAECNAAREAGKGWGNGNLPHMNKPLVAAKKAAA